MIILTDPYIYISRERERIQHCFLNSILYVCRVLAVVYTVFLPGPSCPCSIMVGMGNALLVHCTSRGNVTHSVYEPTVRVWAMHYLVHCVGMDNALPGPLGGYGQCITWSTVRVWTMYYLIHCVGMGKVLPGPLCGYE